MSKAIPFFILAVFCASSAGSVVFSDDFESGLGNWTIDGRQAPGTTNIANTVSRYGSMMGHLYKFSFTEVNFYRIFDYEPQFGFSFDMEVTASSDPPPASNYYGSSGVYFTFRDDAQEVLGTVAYITATTSFPFDQYNPRPDSQYNDVPAGVLRHYELWFDDILPQITIDEMQISTVVMVFNCYSSTYPYPSVSAELWVDNVDYGVIPEPATVSLLAFGALVMLKKLRV